MSERIKTIRGLQEANNSLSYHLNPEESAHELYEMLDEEVHELGEVLNGDRKRVANELADVVLYATELASYYGIDLMSAVNAKMERNFHKYNPYKLQELIAQGMSAKEARKILKEEWNRTNDDKFFENI